MSEIADLIPNLDGGRRLTLFMFFDYFSFKICIFIIFLSHFISSV